MTQFGRALLALNIDIICANSPQAKGRIALRQAQECVWHIAGPEAVKVALVVSAANGCVISTLRAGCHFYLAPTLVRCRTNASIHRMASAALAEINRLVAVAKTLEEEFWALPEGSSAAASTARAAWHGQVSREQAW